jgi:hypothetical protein
MIEGISDDTYEMLKVMEIIRNEYPNSTFTISDIRTIFEKDERITLPKGSQKIRKRLKDLNTWGLIEGENNPYKNNQLEYRLADASDENVPDQVIKTLFSELIRTMTLYLDEKPDALQATQDQLNRGVKLKEFLTVSGENEFPEIDNSTMTHIQLLHENFNHQRFSLVEEERGQGYPLFVFQVRMLSQGFYAAGLKPNGEVGASLKWIRLKDLYEIKPGETFKMPEAQMDFIKNQLVVLTNLDLAQLQE